jgi:2'-5' RNA ligase
VTGPASLVGSENLRLFYGLPLGDESREVLARWAQQTLGGRPGVRLVAPEHLHVTLAFLGSRPSHELPALRSALHEAAAAAERPVLAVERYRETGSVAMIVLTDEDGRAARLQEDLTARLEAIGALVRERRPWLAHVTVARLRERPRLQLPLPALGRVSPSEAALYHSLLRRSGARYEILEAAALGEGLSR